MSAPSSPKTNPGNFFEDFHLGQQIRHATPRTITVGDVALYNGLFGPRFAVQSSDAFAKSIGYPRSLQSTICWCFMLYSARPCRTYRSTPLPILGYADFRFLKPVYPDTTLNAISEVIGLRENSNKKTGIVYVRSRGFDETGDAVIDYARWVMVQKRDQAAPAPQEKVPELPKSVDTAQLGSACPNILRPLTTMYWLEVRTASLTTRSEKKSTTLTALPSRRPSTRSPRGSIRTRHASTSICLLESKGRFGRRLIYGGHVYFARTRIVVQRTGQMPFMLRQSTAGATWHRCLPATRCSPGRKCSAAPNCRDAMTSERCVCRTIATKGSSLRRFPAQERRRLRSVRDTRSRLLGADAPVKRRSIS